MSQVTVLQCFRISARKCHQCWSCKPSTAQCVRIKTFKGIPYASEYKLRFSLSLSFFLPVSLFSIAIDLSSFLSISLSLSLSFSLSLSSQSLSICHPLSFSFSLSSQSLSISHPSLSLSRSLSMFFLRLFTQICV